MAQQGTLAPAIGNRVAVPVAISKMSTAALASDENRAFFPGIKVDPNGDALANVTF